MQIALLGYGNMGKAIEQIALSRGHQISLRQHRNSPAAQLKEQLEQSDVAIEFTAPDAATENILNCFDAGVPVVVGTTGWYSHFEAIKQACNEKQGGLFYATNFSLGVNLFFELNQQLARLMRNYNQYALEIEEIHHIHKKDAPSGTAISLAKGIIENNPAYKAWLNQPHTAPEEIPIISIRQDEVPGTHTIRYTSEIDRIEINHTAFNRKGFALGAVLAAEFMYLKKGIYTMNDLLKLNQNHGN